MTDSRAEEVRAAWNPGRVRGSTVTGNNRTSRLAAFFRAVRYWARQRVSRLG